MVSGFKSLVNHVICSSGFDIVLHIFVGIFSAEKLLYVSLRS